mmetsp:Transcript_89278/g.251250  ORF Transcript_89278/g.251250 Transcript_89278/m.251250 type:complete len:598 (+) Transcript_89278:67-1860(+)
MGAARGFVATGFHESVTIASSGGAPRGRRLLIVLVALCAVGGGSADLTVAWGTTSTTFPSVATVGGGAADFSIAFKSTSTPFPLAPTTPQASSFELGEASQFPDLPPALHSANAPADSTAGVSRTGASEPVVRTPTPTMAAKLAPIVAATPAPSATSAPSLAMTGATSTRVPSALLTSANPTASVVAGAISSTAVTSTLVPTLVTTLGPAPGPAPAPTPAPTPVPTPARSLAPSLPSAALLGATAGGASDAAPNASSRESATATFGATPPGDKDMLPNHSSTEPAKSEVNSTLYAAVVAAANDQAAQTQACTAPEIRFSEGVSCDGELYERGETLTSGNLCVVECDSGYYASPKAFTCVNGALSVDSAKCHYDLLGNLASLVVPVVVVTCCCLALAAAAVMNFDQLKELLGFDGSTTAVRPIGLGTSHIQPWPDYERGYEQLPTRNQFFGQYSTGRGQYAQVPESSDNFHGGNGQGFADYQRDRRAQEEYDEWRQREAHRPPDVGGGGGSGGGSSWRGPYSMNGSGRDATGFEQHGQHSMASAEPPHQYSGAPPNQGYGYAAQGMSPQTQGYGPSPHGIGPAAQGRSSVPDGGCNVS